MSASFHMAQRTGVILSGDYSGENFPPEGKYGITASGTIWKNLDEAKGKVFDASYYYAYWPTDGWATKRKVTSDTMQRYKRENVGWKGDFQDALAAAKKRAGGASAPAAGDEAIGPSDSGVVTLSVLPGTWNDGAYTYVVRSATEVYVPETDKTFMSSSDTWAKFVTALNSTSLKKGKAPVKSSGGGASFAPVNSPALVETRTPFYKAKWFLPVVGVGTVGIVLAIALWPSSKKKAEVAV